MCRLCGLVLLLTSMLAGCSNPKVVSTTDADLTERLALAVESGLLPRFVVDGEPRPGWTMQQRMAHYKVPGVSVAVMVDGEVVLARGFGVRDVETGEPVETDTLFQAASLSKPVTGMAALLLVDWGQLSLDQPVNERLTRWKIPENAFTRQQPVTLRHLLSHRAGTTVHGFPGYPSGAPVPTLPQILDGEPPANTPAVRVDKLPGESYRYSGGGTTIAQLLIEDVTGQDFATFMSTEFLQPMALYRSHFNHPNTDENAARAHVGPDAEPLVGHSHTYPELAAAGLWTTPSELLELGRRFVLALEESDNGIASAARVREVVDAVDEGYFVFGLNEAADGLVLVHSGGNHGYTCRWITYADGRGAVAVMTNGDGGSGLIREILSAVGEAAGWAQDAVEVRASLELPPSRIDALVGSYRFRPDAPEAIRITAKGATLWVEAPFFERTRLHAASPTEFFVTDGLSLRVEDDAAGRPLAIVVEEEIRAERAQP